jgi:hypothetical protein
MPASEGCAPKRGRRFLILALTLIAVAVVADVVIAPSAAGQTSPVPGVTYRPPVAAPVIDPFRPPANPYGPGNRGIEYDTEPGDAVVAAADGTVVFAGAVGGTLHVTVRHADGVRTSYSFLDAIETAAGQRVDQGDRVGRAGETFHFGARIGDAYVDPADLLAGSPTDLALVPHDTPFPAEGSIAAASTQEAGRLPPGLGPDAATHESTAGRAASARRTPCTPRSTPVPPPSSRRRVAVLVGGLGSSSAEAAVDEVDAAALGFARGDVVRFSYAGGRVPGTGTGLSGLRSRAYTAADTLGDIRVAGARLAELITNVAAAAPDATIDLIAHSQGGLAARVAINLLAAGSHPTGGLDRIGVVATIGSPHRGADLATLVTAVRNIPGGGVALEAAQDVAGTSIEPDATSVTQMAEGSDFLRELAAHPLPEGPTVLSIGARGDLVVAGPRTRLEGATNVIVAVNGIVGDHRRLPAAAAVTREIALAQRGRGPTCEGLVESVIDSTIGAIVGWAESGFGLIAGVTPGA